MMNKTKALLLADQAVVSGCALISQLMIAASLGLSVYGIFSAMVLVQLFLLSVQQAGLSGMYQVVAVRMDKSRLQQYDAGIWAVQGYFLLLIAVAGLLIYPLCHFGLTATEAFVVLVNIMLNLLQDLCRRLLLAHGRAMQAFLIDILNNGLQVAGLAVVLWMHVHSFSVTLWICGLSFVPALAVAFYLIQPRPRSRYVGLVCTAHGNEALWMTGSALLQWFAGNFFVIAAGWWLGNAALGALRLGQYLFGLLNVLLQAMENYLLPQAGAMAADPGKTIRYLRAVQYKMLLGAGSILILVLLLVRPVLSWWPAAFPGQLVTVIYGMCATYFFVVAGYPVRIALRTLQLSHAFFKGYLLNAVFGFGTAWFFIHQWHLQGVVAGLLLSQVLLLCYWLAVLQRKFNILWK